jgi:hypothetical protein
MLKAILWVSVNMVIARVVDYPFGGKGKNSSALNIDSSACASI